MVWVLIVACRTSLCQGSLCHCLQAALKICRNSCGTGGRSLLRSQQSKVLNKLMISIEYILTTNQPLSGWNGYIYIPWLSRVLLFLRLGFCPFFFRVLDSNKVSPSKKRDCKFKWWGLISMKVFNIEKYMKDDGILFHLLKCRRPPILHLGSTRSLSPFPINLCTTHTWHFTCEGKLLQNT